MKTLTSFVIAGLTAITLASAAHAGQSPRNGTHPDGQGGALCKGITHCLFLEIECKGTYTDATDKNGTVYGHCTKVNRGSGKLKSNS